MNIIELSKSLTEKVQGYKDWFEENVTKITSDIEEKISDVKTTYADEKDVQEKKLEEINKELQEKLEGVKKKMEDKIKDATKFIEDKITGLTKKAEDMAKQQSDTIAQQAKEKMEACMKFPPIPPL